MSSIVETLAVRLSTHHVVPFLGAGCSFDTLNFDWNSLCQSMKTESGTASNNNLEIANHYVKKFGREKFCEFLGRYLLINSILDEQTEIYTMLLGLGFLSVYTTNQDNVFEKVIERYGQKYNVVFNMETISKIIPKYQTLYKYHGDLRDKDTVVFSLEDYEHRMNDSNNPMDIRLRSDALARSLLFIGYSFRDPNIQLLFESFKKLFEGHLPASFLIQRLPNKAFAQDLKDKYGIIAIDCMEEIPDAKDESDAFTKFLKKLSDAAISLRYSRSGSELFTPSVPIGKRVLTGFQLSGIRESLAKPNSIRIFSGFVDASLIPSDFQESIKDIFIQICKSCTKEEDAFEIAAALFHLELNPNHILECYVSCLTLGNIVTPGLLGHNMSFNPILKDSNPVIEVYAFARAIDNLRAWGRTISPRFYDFVGYHCSKFSPRKEIPGDILKYVNDQFGFAYASGKTTYENPLDRADRLSKTGGPKTHSFSDIRASIVRMLPKDLGRPYGP